MTPAHKTRLPYLYLEHGTLRMEGSGLVWDAGGGTLTDISPTRVATLLLGPGSTVTHAAVKACAGHGMLLQWVGEEGTSAYGASDPLTGDGERLKNQVAVSLNPKWRSRAIGFMYARRFGGKPPEGLDEPTLRGMEGSRVKVVYRDLAQKHGVQWVARRTGSGPGNWAGTDPLNQAISVANGYLLNAAVVSVLTAGYSPAIGFLHTGFNRAYACDICDLHKFKVSVPIAFDVHARKEKDPRRALRHAVRDAIREGGLLDHMIRDAIEVVDAGLGRA